MDTIVYNIYRLMWVVSFILLIFYKRGNVLLDVVLIALFITLGIIASFRAYDRIQSWEE